MPKTKPKTTSARTGLPKVGNQGEGGGRPRFVIDYDAVEKLAGIQCTQEELASYLGCSVDTLTRDAKFCGIYKSAMSKGKMSLRRHQWRALESGDKTMLVWLGKQYLGQSDRQTLANDKDSPITAFTWLPPS